MVTLSWPPNFPDRNPIEQDWYLVKFKIQRIKFLPKTPTTLAEVIRRAWNDMDIHMFNKLGESTPRRIEAVIEAKRGSTKY